MDFHNGNRIIPYRGRTIDESRPVKVYRNLRGKGDFTFSIMQDGRVVGHTNQMMMKRVKCVVSLKGRERVLRQKQKEVHAFLVGLIADSAMGTAADLPELRNEIVYNPYVAPYFRYADNDNYRVDGAGAVKLRNGKVGTYYTDSTRVA